MNYREATEIWKRNGLKLPELPLDECIFPNAERLLEIGQINTDLLEACKKALPWVGKLIADGVHEKCCGPQDALYTMSSLQQAISKTEGK